MLFIQHLDKSCVNLAWDPFELNVCVCVCVQVDDNVTVILLSEIVWDRFRPNTGCFEPLILYFPDYSKGRQH